MSLGVGLPMMKLKPGKCGTRSGMGVREACLEAGSERASKTETLDKSKSGENYRIAIGQKRDDGKYPVEYVDVPSGKEMYDFFETSARDYSERRKREGKKALRKDAPIAATFIIKPEMEKAGDWSENDVRKFALQSLGAWTGVWGHPPDYVIVHMDEGGPHIHIFDRMLDANGDYRMSKVVTRSKLCEWHSKYVEYMNEQGFDVDAHDGLNEDGSPRTHSGQSAKEHAKQEAFDKEQAKERAEFEKQKAELEAEKARVDAREAELRADEQKNYKWFYHLREWENRLNCGIVEGLEKREEEVARLEDEFEERKRRETEELKREREEVEAERAKWREEHPRLEMDYNGLLSLNKRVKERVADVEEREAAVTRREALAVKKLKSLEKERCEVRAVKADKMREAEAEVEGYRRRKRAEVDREVDEQMKRLHRPIQELMGEVIQKDPLRFMADMLKAVADSCDEERINNAKGNPVSITFRNAANRLMELDEFALRDDRNERAFNVWDHAVVWMFNRVKGTIKRNATAPVAPPPAEVYGVDDREGEYSL